MTGALKSESLTATPLWVGARAPVALRFDGPQTTKTTTMEGKVKSFTAAGCLRLVFR